MQAYPETETDKTESLQRFIPKVKQITELIHEFVDKIVVYEELLQLIVEHKA